ncbi:MAG TPA: hypothetical protein RMH26_09885, partial [Polyangiaceae bacterium LLY-WYZ-15_(1-7)]|nr:hypothetical protein [Polyangiaceae bacterium LLY-WYZ-15_(1-7)]
AAAKAAAKKAAAAKAASSVRKKRKKTGRKKKKPKVTAGERLAAAKAAKAAKKQAQRGQEAEEIEDKAEQTAEAASDFLEENRGRILAAIAAVMLLAGGYFGWQYFAEGKAADAAELLWDATETLNAPIRSEEDEEGEAADEEDAEEESYASIEARADATLEELQALFADHAGSDAATHGRLLQGRALYQKGQNEEARSAFQQALQSSDADVRARALEGLAYTYEAEEAWEDAAAQFEELRQSDDPALAILADYHLARVHIAQDDEETAKEKLQAVLEGLREEEAPELGYVRDQAELRLMAIDSTLVQRNAENAMDPEQMRRLIEQMQRQQQQGGGGL